MTRTEFQDRLDAEPFWPFFVEVQGCGAADIIFCIRPESRKSARLNLGAHTFRYRKGTNICEAPYDAIRLSDMPKPLPAAEFKAKRQRIGTQEQVAAQMRLSTKSLRRKENGQGPIKRAEAHLLDSLLAGSPPKASIASNDTSPASMGEVVELIMQLRAAVEELIKRLSPSAATTWLHGRRLVTMAEQAKLLHVHSRTISRLCKRRLIPFVRLTPNKIRFDPIAVEKALAKLTIKERI